MSKTQIPVEIQEKAKEIIAKFNKIAFNDNASIMYYAIFKGCFLFLNRKENLKDGPMARLKFKGKIDKWEFAIYKYSSDFYDPDEQWFPGYEHINGTIEGALKATQKAYPVNWEPTEKELLNFMNQFLISRKPK